MPVQIADPVRQALHIFVQKRQFLADGPGLFAHPRVLQDRPHRVQRRHAGRWRDDPDAPGETLAHHIGETGVKFGVDGFGGEEHQRAVGCFSLDDVTLGDVLHMGLNSGAELARGLDLCAVIVGGAQGLERLQRKLGVDDDGAGRVWQADQAVGPLAVRKRRLKGVGVGRQGLGDDVVELDFPERPARLLVRQNVLEAEDIAGQFLDIRLRLVYDGEALLQLRQRTCGALGGAVEAFAHVLLHGLQPPLHRLDHFGLGRGLHFGDMAEAASQLLLPLIQRLHRLAELAERVR